MVSSHLPARGGSAGLYDCSDQCMVSSHLPARGGSVTISWKCRSIWTFPVTSPRGEDPTCGYASFRHFQFPVTSPRGEDPCIAPCNLNPCMCFQSPPREGRIYKATYGGDFEWAVSSHLPARGGSTRPRMGAISSGPFPVTSPRGEDPCPSAGRPVLPGFQSPPREGRIVHDTRPDL